MGEKATTKTSSRRLRIRYEGISWSFNKINRHQMCVCVCAIACLFNVIKPAIYDITPSRNTCRKWHNFNYLPGGPLPVPKKSYVEHMPHTWIFLFVCKKVCLLYQKKNLPKGKHFTYLEDTAMEDSNRSSWQGFLLDDIFHQTWYLFGSSIHFGRHFFRFVTSSFTTYSCEV